LDGSHKKGYIKHITAEDDGFSTPHLPTDRFKHADTSAVPGMRGDVVFFNLCTVSHPPMPAAAAAATVTVALGEWLPR
jgi:hypothetical protein